MNRIDALIQKGIDNPAAFEAEIMQMEAEIQVSPTAKEALFADFKSSLTAKGQEIDEMKMRVQLAEVSEIISLAYLAKKYFGKTRAWLHQRVNGNLVNGRPARFSSAEMKTLNFALKDISQKIGAISIH